MPKRRREGGIYWRRDCHKYWISFLDANRKRQREPGAENWHEAEELLNRRLAGVRERKKLKPGQVVVCQDSFADVADKFLAYQKPRLSSRGYRREEGIVNQHLKPFFFGLKLAEIKSGQVSDYLTSALGRVSKSSAKKELTLLKHLFRLCYDEWELLPEDHPDPTRKVKAPKVRDERTQHLSPDQFRRLLQASPENYRAIFALLTATGMRRSELIDCRWRYVDGTRILLPTSKNDQPKEIHLNEFAQRVLAVIPQGGPEDRLFPDVTTPEAVSVAFHRVCKVLGFHDIRLHDLRHTFGTWLRQRGVELDVIASQLGHRDLRMTKRYARIAGHQVKQAVDGLDSMLAETENEPTGHVSVTLPPVKRE
jgi:integrase